MQLPEVNHFDYNEIKNSHFKQKEIAQIFEGGGLIVLTNHPINFNPESFSNIQYNKYIWNRQLFAYRPEYLFSHTPTLFKTLKENYQFSRHLHMDLSRIKSLLIEAKKIEQALVKMCSELLPFYNLYDTDKIQWRLFEVNTEPLHLDELKDTNGKYHPSPYKPLRIFLNLDTKNRVWNHSYNWNQLFTMDEFKDLSI